MFLVPAASAHISESSSLLAPLCDAIKVKKNPICLPLQQKRKGEKDHIHCCSCAEGRKEDPLLLFKKKKKSTLVIFKASVCYKPLAVTVIGCLANDFSNHCWGSSRSKSKRSPALCLPGQYVPSTVPYTNDFFKSPIYWLCSRLSSWEASTTRLMPSNTRASRLWARFSITPCKIRKLF